jgi:hypothetical protein
MVDHATDHLCLAVSCDCDVTSWREHSYDELWREAGTESISYGDMSVMIRDDEMRLKLTERQGVMGRVSRDKVDVRPRQISKV